MLTDKQKNLSWPFRSEADQNAYITDYQSSYRQYSSCSRVPLACIEERRYNPQPPKIQLRSTYQDTYYTPWKGNTNNLMTGKHRMKVMITSQQTSTQQCYKQPHLTDRLKGPTTRYGSSPIVTKPAQGTLPTLTRKAEMNSRQHTHYAANYGSSASKFHLPMLEDCRNSLKDLGSNGLTRKVRFRRKSKKDCDSGWAGPY